MCIPVYGIMEDLEGTYKHIKFADMEFDNPESSVIRNAPECRGFYGITFYRLLQNGKLVKATTIFRDEQQITTIIDAEFGKP